MNFSEVVKFNWKTEEYKNLTKPKDEGWHKVALEPQKIRLFKVDYSQTSEETFAEKSALFIDWDIKKEAD